MRADAAVVAQWEVVGIAHFAQKATFIGIDDGFVFAMNSNNRAKFGKHAAQCFAIA